MASAIFLFGKRQNADGWALAAAELTVVFGVITLVTGPLWARKAWGVWWVWDARLTSSLVLWMIFVAYLLLRRYGGPGSEKLGAGVALFGMANVPFVYVSVNCWRTIHPQTSVVPTLPVQMGGPLWFCVFAFLLLFLVLLSMRARLERQRVRSTSSISPRTKRDAILSSVRARCRRCCCPRRRRRRRRSRSRRRGRVRAGGAKLPPAEQMPAVAARRGGLRLRLGGGGRLRVVDRAAAAEGRSGDRPTSSARGTPMDYRR